MRFTFTRHERIDLLKSWLLVSLAFAFFIVRIEFDKGFLVALAYGLAVALVTVGLGFMVHELSHKWFANRYCCHAEYIADDFMLLLSLGVSLLGFFIAAPGAVHISGHADRDENGKISLAGPVANLVLALFFLAAFFLTTGWLRSAAGLGTIVNSYLSLFNLLPFGFFDGAKVVAWNKAVYGITTIVAALLVFASFMLVQTQLGLF